MDIAEIKEGMNDVEFSGVITEISAPREVITKFGTNTVANAKISDETGNVTLSLWGKQISLFKVGDRIEVKGGYTRSFRGDIQISVGKMGSLKKVED